MLPKGAGHHSLVGFSLSFYLHTVSQNLDYAYQVPQQQKFDLRYDFQYLIQRSYLVEVNQQQGLNCFYPHQCFHRQLQMIHSSDFQLLKHKLILYDLHFRQANFNGKIQTLLFYRFLHLYPESFLPERNLIEVDRYDLFHYEA